MPNAAHDLSPNGLKAFTFYRAERMHSADYAVTRCLSVRLSVRLSITRRYCVLTVTHILKVFPPSGSPTILVFPHQTGWQFSDKDPLTGASNTRGYE